MTEILPGDHLTPGLALSSGIRFLLDFPTFPHMGLGSSESLSVATIGTGGSPDHPQACERLSEAQRGSESHRCGSPCGEGRRDSTSLMGMLRHHGLHVHGAHECPASMKYRYAARACV